MSIPEDIRKTAEETVNRLFRLGKHRSAPVWHDPVGLIAAALMIERERCAKICDDFAKEERGFTELEYAGQELARLIRSHPDTSKGTA